MEENNSLCYWFPKIQDLNIPQPKTYIIKLKQKDLSALFNSLDGDTSALSSIIAKLKNESEKVGFPIFLRTDLASGKHEWENTCFISSADKLVTNLMNVVEFNVCVGGWGLPFKALVIREFLELESTFKAFYGKMPIARERRYFIKDGKVQCHHPYWPEDAISQGSPPKLLPSNWKAKLHHLNYEFPAEIKFLSEYAERVGEVMPGYWSVDFAKGKNGLWYLIDMALGERSWHEESCKFSSTKKKKPLTSEELKTVFEST